jgi:signal transduction histidine kinase
MLDSRLDVKTEALSLRSIERRLCERGAGGQQSRRRTPPSEVRDNLVDLQHCGVFKVGEAAARGWQRSCEEPEERVKQHSARLVNMQESERQRIARDLHDDIGQTLSVIRIGCEHVSELLTAGSITQAKVELNSIVPLIKNATKQVRRIALDLRPPVIDIGLVAALKGLARQFRLFHPQINLEEDIQIAEQEVPQDIKLPAYRIAQEAFNNIMKHADGGWVYLGLHKVENELHLVVQDDGIGFDIREGLHAARHDRGVGLGSMEARATMSGGQFSIDSVRRKGTKIMVSWRCPSRAKRRVVRASAPHETYVAPAL